MIASWLMERRRSGRATVLGALWPLVVDLACLAGVAALVMGWTVASAYAEVPRDGAIVWVPMLAGIVLVAGGLSVAVVTTVRVLLGR